MEHFTDGTGQKLLVHNVSKCHGTNCPIHNPSDHHMKDWPLHWRHDKGVFERICPHGVGHPDPDDITIKKNPYCGIHCCDGCCKET